MENAIEMELAAVEEREPFEWESHVNDPERQARADSVQCQREENIRKFHEKRASARKSYFIGKAAWYAVMSLVFTIAACLLGIGHSDTGAILCGMVAVFFMAIAFYGFGRAREM